MGYLFALLAAAVFGSNGSLAKLIIEAGLSPVQLTQFRTVGTAVLAGAVLLITDRAAFRLPRRQLLVMAVLGVGGVALLQASYAVAIQLLPVGIALLLEYTAVLMVALVAFFVFRERVKARIWVAIGLVLVGLAVVARVWASTLDPLGVLLAMVAAMTLAFYFIVGERQVVATSPMTVAFWTMIFATAFWLPFSGWWELTPASFAAPVQVGGAVGELTLPLALPLVVTVVLGSFTPFLLSFYALKHLTATAAGIVASSEVLFAFVVAWLWLGEQLDLLQIAGAAVVLAGIVLAQTARSAKTVVDADLALRTGPVALP
ncbi:MAG: DMT family transporter [Microbacteriaceae bacterium]|nr:DMT family transporter [Microbacteriaceae bacterium]